MHPSVQDFKKSPLEFLGDIGSLRALADQGVDREVLEPWIRALDDPVRFSTGGGPQLSTEALKLYCKELGELNLHLLSNCPMALSIGKQVARGRTFIWQHGQKPYIALNHRRCRVWCPADNRHYAQRVQNNVPIFAVEDKRQMKQLMPAQEEPFQLSQPVACASEEQSTSFCGSCLERVPACACRLDDVNESLHAAAHAPVRDHGSGINGCANEDSLKEHVRRKHRKDNRRRKWEAKKLTTQSKDPL